MKKGKSILLIAGLIALLIVAGVWAFYTSTTSLDNRLKTVGRYGETLIEKFTPTEEWKSGQAVPKEVRVRNTGNAPIVARIKLNEVWWRDSNSDGTMQDPQERLIGHDSVTNGISDITSVSQVNATDGSVLGDKTVVEKTLAALDWTAGADGYWYYNNILNKGMSTANFMTAIKLAANTDMGLKRSVKYYTESASVSAQEPTFSNIGSDPKTQWVIYTGAVPSPTPPETTVYTKAVSGVDGTRPGYANAIYDLFITIETVQANKDAVDATWAGASTNLPCYSLLQ